MSTRMPAEERRAAVVEIARRHFARDGFRGASTDAIAREVGVSQPYLFRLFGTKRHLFLACCAANLAAIRGVFERAEPELPAMGSAYMELLGDREVLLLQLQGYAASADPEIRAAIRWGYGQLVEYVRERTGAGEAEVWAFMARGMLLTVAASLDLPGEDAPWAAAWEDPQGLMQAMSGGVLT